MPATRTNSNPPLAARTGARAGTVGRSLLVAFAAIFAAALPRDATAEENSAYVVEVGDVTARVGGHEVMRATLRLRDGYRILQGYNNRVMALSSLDDSVVFDSEVVRGTVEDGALVFLVGVRPTKPGRHPINGIFRVGYVEGETGMSMVSLKLIASVTGAEQGDDRHEQPRP